MSGKNVGIFDELPDRGLPDWAYIVGGVTYYYDQEADEFYEAGDSIGGETETETILTDTQRIEALENLVNKLLVDLCSKGIKPNDTLLIKQLQIALNTNS